MLRGSTGRFYKDDVVHNHWQKITQQKAISVSITMLIFMATKLKIKAVLMLSPAVIFCFDVCSYMVPVLHMHATGC